jgi:putative ABC transport system permease protein
MAVRERTKEIGTMRAIGAPKRLIVELFLVEAMLLGFLAAVFGVVIGTAVTLGVNALNIPVTNDGARLFLMANTMRFNLHASQVVTTLLLFTAVTSLAALYPALAAARLRPVEALMQGK